MYSKCDGWAFSYLIQRFHRQHTFPARCPKISYTLILSQGGKHFHDIDSKFFLIYSLSLSLSLSLKYDILILMFSPKIFFTAFI